MTNHPIFKEIPIGEQSEIKMKEDFFSSQTPLNCYKERDQGSEKQLFDLSDLNQKNLGIKRKGSLDLKTKKT